MTDEDYADAFIPREFQARLIEAVIRDHDAGKRVTVGIASPGSGKTLAYQAAATALIRRGAIDLVAVYAPRIALATQCELEYRTASDEGHFELFDPRARLESITHRRNNPPLTAPGATRAGFVTTYSSLTRDPSVHLDWARKHSGRFLLVGDEAQFLGAPDEDGDDMGGTKAAELFLQMHEHAAHTIMLTGTEKRADDGELVLARYDTRDDGKRYLSPDVRASYSDGIAQGYLRPFEAHLVDANVDRLIMETGEAYQEALSRNGKQLNQVLQQEHVWRELADLTIQKLRNAQVDHSGYKALIACQRQDEARKVHRHLEQRGVRSELSVSADGREASAVLDRFKFNDSDVLVTVRKAFLGYDCKQITVVGLLTNYRDQGHLEQLVGRGLRVADERPAESQWCRIVAPNDPNMVKFLEGLEQEKAQGLGKRKIQSPRTPGDEPPEPREPSIIVDSAMVTEITATGHAGYVDTDGMGKVGLIHEQVPTSRLIPEADLLKILNSNTGAPMPQKPVRHSQRKTREQIVSDYKAQADKDIKAAASAREEYSPAAPRRWTQEKQQIHAELNKRLRRMFGYRDSDSIRRDDVNAAKWYGDAARELRLSVPRTRSLA